MNRKQSWKHAFWRTSIYGTGFLLLELWDINFYHPQTAWWSKCSKLWLRFSKHLFYWSNRHQPKGSASPWQVHSVLAACLVPLNAITENCVSCRSTKKWVMTRDLICTVHPTVLGTSPGPDPSGHPLRLWCAWSSRCWRRTPSPPGCLDAYTSVTSDEQASRNSETHSDVLTKGTVWSTSELLPLPTCWNPACGPSDTPCFACVQSGGYRPWWTPHVLAWVQPGMNNAGEVRLS